MNGPLRAVLNARKPPSQLALKQIRRAIASAFEQRVQRRAHDITLVQEFFAEIDVVIDLVESQTGTALDSTRFDCKRSVLNEAVAGNRGSVSAFLEEYDAAPDFSGKNRILLDVGKAHIADDVVRLYGPRQRSVGTGMPRQTGQEDGKLAHGDVVRQVCRLFSLEDHVTAEHWQQLNRSAHAGHRNTVAAISQGESVQADPRAKSVIALLMRHFPEDDASGSDIDGANHPASVMLQAITAFRLPPAALSAEWCEATSPYSLATIAKTLTRKYFFHKDRLEEAAFFDHAFVMQDADYAATVKQLMEHDTAGESATPPPHPSHPSP
jgi:hypothetical protein